jgi:tRNA(Ile)-lysidine synthetase-like protein
VSVAVSGGPDSMAVMDFLKRGNKLDKAYYFNHGTEHGKDAEAFLLAYCEENKIDLVIGHISREKGRKESAEEYWRNERYSFLEKHNDVPVVTCHNLDDQVETWVFTSLHGCPKLIPYRRGNIIRPFVVSEKSDMLGWCAKNSVQYVTDPGNSDKKYMRSFIRTELIPKSLYVNPGLFKVIKKKVLGLAENEAPWYNDVAVVCAADL